MWEAIGCYGLLLACTLGPTIMWAVGVITFEWMMQIALASNVYTKTPTVEFGTGNAYTVGQAFGFTFFYLYLLFLYLVIGAGLGILTAARVVRFSRWWSQHTAMLILILTLLNGIINLVGSSFLTTLILVEFSYPQAKNPVTFFSAYALTRIMAAILIASSLLILHLALPRWVREITGHR
ncbi:MAG: hypothetical protein F6K00_16500 [Leptolyngbya sp. SIOISBB]|nr:hypothetical protein [Leptolyngbya sp. SIOISBB]